MYLIHRRILIVLALLSALMLMVAGRFFLFQVVKGPEIAEQANTMRTKGFSLSESKRGAILDRNYRPLTGQQRHLACFCMPFLVKDIDATSHLLAGSLNIPEKTIARRIREAKRRGDIIILLKTPITSLGIGSDALSGIIAVPITRRYQDNGFLIHLLGHLQEATGSNQTKAIGDAGLEARYEEYLKAGSYPAQLAAVVDGRGKTIPGLSPKTADPDRSGESCDVVATIDRKVQLITEESMDRHVSTGAVVVIDIKSRDVLAMASRPTYDPNQPSSYLHDADSAPLLNRALASFHPGSLFKVVVAAAALETGAVSPNEVFECYGLYSFSEKVSIPCWKETGHGRVNIGQALSESCNTAFIEMGLRVGREGLLQLSKRMHVFDQDIIGYQDAQKGSGLKIDYGRPAVGNASLGQAGVMMTPLQTANMMATVVDDGLYKRPRIVKEVRIDQNIVRRYPADKGSRVLSSGTSRQLVRYLRLVTTTGTGKLANIGEAGCGGKTATSQTGQFTAQNEEILDTWFVGFFPAEKPRWVISVLVEHGQSGGHNAAPVFSEIAQQMMVMDRAGAGKS